MFCLYTIHSQTRCTKLELIEQQLFPKVMNKDLAPIFTTIRKIRQHDTVQVLRRASMTASLQVSAASFHCPEDSLFDKSPK